MTKAYGLSLADCKKLLADAPTWTVKPAPVKAKKLDHRFVIEEPDGQMTRGEPGDYLLCDQNGHFRGREGAYYAVIGKRFEETFDLEKPGA